MRRFLKALGRFILIGLIPFTLLLAGYLYSDPFKVLYKYSDYSYPFVVPNRDYISTEIFNRNKEKYKYNSFILGSSRTHAFRPSSWQKHLDETASPYMFDANNESVYGIYTKLKYLDSIGVKPENVLIILCRDQSFLNSENHKGHLFVKHPATSGESAIRFQNEFFKAYLNPKFLFSFITYNFIKEYKPFMHGYIEYRRIHTDTVTNEFNILDQEAEISENPVQYYLKRKDHFYKRPGERKDTVQRISHKQRLMLEGIKSILVRNNTDYKIITSPLYEQTKFSDHDIKILRDLFGNRLFDFSGKNDFTEHITNYYETSHYRPLVGDSILNILYSNKQN